MDFPPFVYEWIFLRLCASGFSCICVRVVGTSCWLRAAVYIHISCSWTCLININEQICAVTAWQFFKGVS